MMEESIKEKLIAFGFDNIPTKKREHHILFKFVNGTAVVVQLLSVRFGDRPSTEQYDSMRHQIYQMFYQKGFQQIDLLTVFLTKEPDCVKDISTQLGTYWIVDKIEQRILIYENQPTHYYQVEKIIQDGMEEVIRRKSNLLEQGKYLFSHRAICNYTIILINILAFLVLEILGDTQDAEYMISKGAIYTPLVIEYHQYYRLFTAIFLHFGIQHLLNNMMVLAIIGDYVERSIGKLKYCVIFILTGFIGNLMSLYMDYITMQDIVSAGASGAVFGVIGALFYIIIINKGRLEDMTTRQIIIFIAFSLYLGFTSSNVDNAAHLGGLLSGVLLGGVLYRRKRTV